MNFKIKGIWGINSNVELDNDWRTQVHTIWKQNKGTTKVEFDFDYSERTSSSTHNILARKRWPAIVWRRGTWRSNKTSSKRGKENCGCGEDKQWKVGRKRHSQLTERTECSTPVFYGDRTGRDGAQLDCERTNTAFEFPVCRPPTYSRPSSFSHENRKLAGE